MRNIGSVRAAGIAALVALAGAGLPGSATAVEADPTGTPVSSLSLPVPASDVSHTDTDLADTAREVVVVSPGAQGPEVRKLRARTQAEAVTLARALDARPGVVAQVNRVVSLRQPSPSTATKPVAAFPRVAARSALTVGLGSEPLGAQQWGMGWVNAEAAWTVTRGSGVVVAVVDTGVDSTHPDLSGQLLPQADFVPDGLTGDPQGHGTHVAGIIVAALNGQGIAGLANQAKVLPVRVLDATGTGDDFTISAGIHAAVDSGARVLNMSLGGDYSVIEAEAIKYAVDHDVTVVAAGGNSYLEGNPVNYPAALPGVLAVSSLSPEGASSEFANTGSYIDLVAPGEQIASTIPGGWALDVGHLDGVAVRGCHRGAHAGGEPDADEGRRGRDPHRHRPGRPVRQRLGPVLRLRTRPGRPRRPGRSHPSGRRPGQAGHDPRQGGELRRPSSRWT